MTACVSKWAGAESATRPNPARQRTTARERAPTAVFYFTLVNFYFGAPWHKENPRRERETASDWARVPRRGVILFWAHRTIGTPLSTEETNKRNTIPIQKAPTSCCYRRVTSSHGCRDGVLAVCQRHPGYCKQQRGTPRRVAKPAASSLVQAMMGILKSSRNFSHHLRSDFPRVGLVAISGSEWIFPSNGLAPNIMVGGICVVGVDGSRRSCLLGMDVAVS